MADPINTTLNDVWKSTSVGDINSATGAALYGISRTQNPGAVPVNRDNHGYTFFTRPQLNLTDDNASAIRTFVPLLTTDDTTYQRMVRKLLDPRLTDIVSPMVDDRQVFIPMLSNMLLTITGFPDPTLDVHQSKPGIYKEVQSIVDSVNDQYAPYRLSATFRNMDGDPIMSLFDMWRDYQSAVFIGKMMPYPDFIGANEIDYCTRVYRVVLDRTRRYVQKIAACGAMFPISTPRGASFDYDHSKPINQSNDQIQINFEVNGFIYNDPVLIQEFNAAVQIFNPSMRDDRIATSMVQVPPILNDFFDNMGYPRIDPDTSEFQWWVSNAQYQAVLAGYTRNAQALNIPYDINAIQPGSTPQPD